MATQINVSLSAIANVLALINADNAGANLTEEKVQFGTPTERIPNANPNNTYLGVSAKAGGGIPGDPITVNYSRISLGNAVVDPDIEFTVEGNDAAAETAFLAAVATQLGLVPGEFAVAVNTPFAAIVKGAGPVSIGLTPNADSLLYNTGVEVNVTWPADGLDTLVANKQLDGFSTAA